MRGKLRFMSPPNSRILKKRLSIIFGSLEAPRLIRPEILRFSAPLNKFLACRVGLKARPRNWILEWVTSKSVPKEYLGRGDRYILAVSSEAVLSATKSILGYLKVFRLVICRYVLRRSISL